MSFSQIQAALDAHLEAFQADDVAWENTHYAPREGTPYLEPRMAARQRRPLGPGADSPVEWVGIYQINVRYPAGDGMQPIGGAVDALSAHFARGTGLTTAGGLQVTIEIPSPPPALVSADWVMVPVQVQWFALETPA